MFSKVLAAGVIATGIGFAGTATELQAGDRHHDRGHRHHHHGGHDHHGRHHDHGGRFHIQPFPYHGGHHHHHDHGFDHHRHGGFYGSPWGGRYYGGRSGFFIGTNRFQLGIYR